MCNEDLGEKEDFFSHGVGYSFCDSCGHLNGLNKDTKKFVDKTYISNFGDEYSKNYLDLNYKKRVEDIYIPKVDFLLKNIPVRNFSVLDLGCGSGFFVAACMDKNVKSSGVDVNKTMVDFGNTQIKLLFNKEDSLKVVDENDFYHEIANTKNNVVSAIGVIEHLRSPQSFFESFKQSDALYLYYSVPMFSFSVITEIIFKEIFPRQLSGGHTHLFTEQSIKKMHKILGVESVAEWRFGTDFMDLYRSVITSLSKRNVSEKMMGICTNSLSPMIDKMQSIMDESYFCSEIHCLVQKTSPLFLMEKGE